MKRRGVEPDASPQSGQEPLCRALLALDDLDVMSAFLRDLCTPAELEALTDRWKVVSYILKDVPYRQIHEQTGVSITTVGRVARYLNDGNGGYLAAARALGLADEPTRDEPRRQAGKPA